MGAESVLIAVWDGCCWRLGRQAAASPAPQAFKLPSLPPEALGASPHAMAAPGLASAANASLVATGSLVACGSLVPAGSCPLIKSRPPAAHSTQQFPATPDVTSGLLIFHTPDLIQLGPAFTPHHLSLSHTHTHTHTQFFHKLRHAWKMEGEDNRKKLWWGST